MSPSQEKLEAAAREIAERARESPGDMIAHLKHFKKIGLRRLQMWHRAGGGGLEVARSRSDHIDALFRVLFESVARQVAPEGLGGKLCVAAFGGYGRRELVPFSDVDILFLVEKSKKSDAKIEEVIRQTLVALWDVGFKVGHATRTIGEAVKKANEDMVTKTSMLESRFLAGKKDIFDSFRKKFEAECVHGREKEYIAWRLANQADLRAKHGASVFLQEPNVKGGVGGLRDYQSLLWISHFKLGTRSTAGLVEAKILDKSERRQLDKSYDFLLRTRSEMHYLNNRAADALTLQLQGRVAIAFGYGQKNILRKVEAFMRDYYSHTRNIHLTTESALERMRVVPAKKPAGLLGMIGRPKTENFDGFVARDGKIAPENEKVFSDDPCRMIRAFHHAQVRQIDFHSDLSDLIRANLARVNRTFQYSKSARETFFAILSHKGAVAPVLRRMHDLGFLGRYMPEFGALDCLVQHEFYHRYTVDEHTLVCIEKLDEILFAKSEKLRGYREIFQKIEDPVALYLALLLHDTGKAANERHHEEASALLAYKVARRLQLSPERRKMLVTLVDTHCVLSKMARTRNLEDQATILEFCKIVGDRANLDALMLITLADGMGTSDENWSDWKEGLVWTLYERARQHMEGGPGAALELTKSREDLKQGVLKLMGADFGDEVEAHFALMSARYFQMFGSETIAGHLRLFREFFANQKKDDAVPLAPVFQWEPRPDQGHTEVWICGWDRPRLLERMAGAFLSAQVNILSADIFTRSDSLVLDIFRVASMRHEPVDNPRDIARVESRLAESLRFEDFDFTPLVAKETRLRSYRISQDFELPTKIKIDTESHPTYTLIDIQTPDRLGLLYDLLRAMGKEGLLIELSRITTEMDVAMDSFYVHGKNGSKIDDPAATKRLQRVLFRAATKK